MKLSAILLIITMSAPVFGQATSKKMRMHKNVNAMKREIAKQIPVGSSIKEAQRIMEANGFGCAIKEQAKFTVSDGNKPDVEYANLDFLYCKKEKPVWYALLHTGMWEVAFISKEDRVTNILASFWWNCEL
jgi:hypothetical protein